MCLHLCNFFERISEELDRTRAVRLADTRDDHLALLANDDLRVGNALLVLHALFTLSGIALLFVWSTNFTNALVAASCVD